MARLVDEGREPRPLGLQATVQRARRQRETFRHGGDAWLTGGETRCDLAPDALGPGRVGRQCGEQGVGVAREVAEDTRVRSWQRCVEHDGIEGDFETRAVPHDSAAHAGFDRARVVGPGQRQRDGRRRHVDARQRLQHRLDRCDLRVDGFTQARERGYDVAHEDEQVRRARPTPFDARNEAGVHDRTVALLPRERVGYGAAVRHRITDDAETRDAEPRADGEAVRSSRQDLPHAQVELDGDAAVGVVECRGIEARFGDDRRNVGAEAACRVEHVSHQGRQDGSVRHRADVTVAGNVTKLAACVIDRREAAA